MFRRLRELITTFRDVWECISSRLGDVAEGLKPERIQEPAAPDDPDDPETASEDSRKQG